LWQSYILCRCHGTLLLHRGHALSASWPLWHFTTGMHKETRTKLTHSHSPCPEPLRTLAPARAAPRYGCLHSPWLQLPLSESSIDSLRQEVERLFSLPGVWEALCAQARNGSTHSIIPPTGPLLLPCSKLFLAGSP
jgi:hypothetical protein